MNKQIRVGTSPLTGIIFAGHVLKDGKTWAANKQDVTIEALQAVVNHVLNADEDSAAVALFDVDQVPIFKITVERIKDSDRDKIKFKG